MSMKLAKDFIIPKCVGMAFEVLRGQVLRIIEVEGPQAGDMTMLNLRDFRETFSSHISVARNGQSFCKVDKLYSGPPFFNRMFSLVDDKTGAHWVHGRCTKLSYPGQPNHRNCHDNIVESLAPWEISEHAVPLGTVNVFTNVLVHRDGSFQFQTPVSVQGDYIDFQAEMDLLVSISACPNDGIINSFQPKPLQIQILESS